MEVIFHQQRLELEVEKAMREILDAEARDYDEYMKEYAFEGKKPSFSQWFDMKYRRLKHIRKWTRKQLRDTTCL